MLSLPRHWSSCLRSNPQPPRRTEKLSGVGVWPRNPILKAAITMGAMTKEYRSEAQRLLHYLNRHPFPYTRLDCLPHKPHSILCLALLARQLLNVSASHLRNLRLHLTLTGQHPHLSLQLRPNILLGNRLRNTWPISISILQSLKF